MALPSAGLHPALAAAPASAISPARQALPLPAPTPAEARAIAEEAWLYAYAPLQGYQTFWNQTQNKEFPGYVGGFNQFRHYSRSATPADTDIVTPNNDTPYSWAWLDLRAEPIVLSLPAVPAARYYVNQWFDLYTHNFAYTGVRATGRSADHYLFISPHWQGTVPKGITKVFRAETDFVGTLTRTQLNGPDDIPALRNLQSQYKLTPPLTLQRHAAPEISIPRELARLGSGQSGGDRLHRLPQRPAAIHAHRALRERLDGAFLPHRHWPGSPL
jgi:hypothetical protein